MLDHIRKRHAQRVVFALSYLIMVLFGFFIQALPPLFQHLTAEIPFSHAKEGFLMGAFGIPGLVVPTLGAGLMQRLHPRRVLLAGLGVMVGGVALFVAAHAYWLLFAARFIQGCGGMMLVVVAPLLVNKVFPKEKIGRVIGFFNTGVPLGLVLATTLFSRFGSSLGWRTALGITGVAAVAVFALIALFLPVETFRPSAGDGAQKSRGAMIGGAIFLMGLVNVLVNAGTAPFGAFAPQFFSSVGIAPGKASLIISIMMIETTLLGPFIGILVDRIRNPRLFLIGAGILIAAGFASLLSPGIPLVTGPLLLGAATAIVPVAMFPFLNEMVSPERVGAGLAVLITASNIGNNIGLGVFGVLLDHSGGFETGFVILGVLGLLVCPVVLNIRRKSRKPELALEM